MIVPSFACIVALLSFKRLFCRTAYANTQEVLQTMKKEYWQELVEKWEEADTNDDEHELGRGEEEEEKKLGRDKKLKLLYRTLSSKVVRDLAFAVGSVSLLEPLEIQEKEGTTITPTALVGKCLNFFSEKQLRWIYKLDDDPTPLLEAIRADKTAKVLGNYFAKLWEFYLLNAPKPLRFSSSTSSTSKRSRKGAKMGDNRHYFELVQADNAITKLQVRDTTGKRTLGAFDLVFVNNGELEHWEISFKCKLWAIDSQTIRSLITNTTATTKQGGPAACLPPPPTLIDCSGPHQSETLQDKVDKVKKQLRLSRKPEGRKALETYYGNDSKAEGFSSASSGSKGWRNRSKINVRCVLHGFVLYPLKEAYHLLTTTTRGGGGEEEKNEEEKQRSIALLQYQKKIGVRCAKGWYTEDVEDLKRLQFAPKSSLWLILPKLWWLGPAPHGMLKNLIESGEILTTEEFIKEVKRRRNCENTIERRKRVFVAQIGFNRSMRVYEEISRGFVMEKGWLQKYLNKQKNN
mmetsp:Transcript_20617/g.33257  ORF Transcript_20617/g.33257 Transcript_20617/m.33257 type:complete len:518 (+) Transcript_20617:132-1685(+)